MLFVEKALQPGLSKRVCRKVNMPFVAFSGRKSTENTVLLNLLAIIMIRKLSKLQNTLSFTLELLIK